MTRLKAAVARLFSGDKRTAGSPAADPTIRTLRRQLDDVTRALAALDNRLEHSLSEADRQLRLQREQLFEQASLAAVPRARLLSESIVLEGRPSERVRIRRLRVGEPVERRFSPWVGITRCASDAPEVRELWERLLRFEAECGDDVLRGSPCTILDVPGASASIVEGKLRVVPTRPQPSSADVVAVPRCTYDVTTRKIANFGHWMLDWAPQVVALWKVAPGATFLMPQPARAFHTETLARIGLDVRQMVPWDGASVACGRLVAFESDGRTGGGRPLSPLMDVRRLLAPRDGSPASRTRRIYVSRRDAPKKRKWIVNEADVEELFRRRGFEVIVMRDYSLDEQIRVFREARVVAGINGGGLTDIIFSASGIDVIVLLSDTLIRWYAGGGRSVWTGGRRGGAGQLAALGDSPRFWTHVAVTFEQRCHSFVGGDEMPLAELAQFLDDVLADIEAAR
jgi:hypothetical protein